MRPTRPAPFNLSTLALLLVGLAISLLALCAGCDVDRPLVRPLTCGEALELYADDCVQRRPNAAIQACKAELHAELSPASRLAWENVWRCWHGDWSFGFPACVPELEACRAAP